MQIIQSLTDLEMLKKIHKLPTGYIKVIEGHLMSRFKVEGNGNSVLTFQLPDDACIYHLSDKEEEHELLQHINDFQYVKVKTIDNVAYFEIKVDSGGDINIYIFVEGTLDDWTEQWLRN